MTMKAPVLSARPYGIGELNAMFRTARGYLDYSAVLIQQQHKSLAERDAAAAGKHVAAYNDAMQRFPRAWRSLEGLLDAAQVAAFGTHVDPTKCLKVHDSFGALSEAMHAVFWSCPGEFWDSPKGVIVAERFDRAMAQARQAYDELTRTVHDAEDARKAANA